MDVSEPSTGPLESEEVDQLMLVGSIALLLLLLTLLLFYFQGSYHTDKKVPECDAPVVLDQLRNSGLAVSLSAARDSIESIALDPVIGHRICLVTLLESAGADEKTGRIKFVVRVTDRLPSLLRVEVVGDRIWLKQATVSGHTVD